MYVTDAGCASVSALTGQPLLVSSPTGSASNWTLTVVHADHRPQPTIDIVERQREVDEDITVDTSIGTGTADGDGDGFADLVAQHHERLARLAYVLCGNREEAEDAVAEAYAKVWPRYRAGTLREPLSYLRTAVVNQVRGGLRRRVLQRREEQRQRVDWRDGVSAERAVDDRDAIVAAVARLPVEQRTILVLRFYEDMSEQDVAATLGVPIGTVKSRCSRALAALRVALDGRC